MFLSNKYTKLYNKIIIKSINRNHTKVKGDNYQKHHIIPRCMGGTDTSDNIALLTYKEHRICHRLLIQMTEGETRYKMMYAYKLFNKNYDNQTLPNPSVYCTSESYVKMVDTRKRKGSYKTGANNIFSSDKIKDIVRDRMLNNNPMKSDEQRNRMKIKNNNPNVKPIEVEGLVFPTLNAAARYFNTTPHLLKKKLNYRFLSVA